MSLRDRGVSFATERAGHGAAERPGRTCRVADGGPPGRRLRVDAVGRVIDGAGTFYDIGAAIDALRWQTALPSSGAPHGLGCARDGDRPSPRQLPRLSPRQPAPTRYLESGGWRFWRTSAGRPGGVIHMLNRCRPESDVLRRVGQGAGPMEWEGPPWLEYGSTWPPGWVYEPGTDRGGGRHGDWVYRAALDTRRDYRCVVCRAAFYWHPGRPCPICGTPATDAL